MFFYVKWRILTEISLPFAWRSTENVADINWKYNIITEIHGNLQESSEITENNGKQQTLMEINGL